MNEKYLRRRHYSNPNGFTTSSPVFYQIPWTPMDYSMTGLGPGQSVRFPDEFHYPPSMYASNHNLMPPNAAHPHPPQHHRDSGRYGINNPLDYSKSGFTYFNNNQCTCGFLSGWSDQQKYRNQFNQQRLKAAGPAEKPWWTGRELTSKFDPTYPTYSTSHSNSTSEGLSTYSKDYRGLYGDPAPRCNPEGEIERAEKTLSKKNKEKTHKSKCYKY